MCIVYIVYQKMMRWLDVKNEIQKMITLVVLVSKPVDHFPSLVDLVCSCHHTSIAISDNTSPYGNHCHLATLVTTVCWARTRVSFARESRAVSALTLCSAASRLKYQASRQPNTNPIMRRCHDTSFLPADTGPHSALGIVLQLM